MRWPAFRIVKINKRLKRHIRWGCIHVAFLFFFADLIASVWPAFEEMWKNASRVGVAGAAFLATLSEYFVGEEEDTPHHER